MDTRLGYSDAIGNRPERQAQGLGQNHAVENREATRKLATLGGLPPISPVPA